MENKIYFYKKSSHLNISYEPNNVLPYTDTQFEEDSKKWFTETKKIQNDNINKLSVCLNNEIIKLIDAFIETL